MRAEKPLPVKYFIGALYSDENLLKQAMTQCELRIGSIDLKSAAFPFDMTAYYESEMGTSILRMMFSFETLHSPGELARLKVLCNEIEDDFSMNSLRKINLDIGYMDFHKLVLASAKYNGQKIYLDQGIYADTTLIFESGKFKALENTFPDFKSGRYDSALLEFRNKYKSQLKRAIEEN